LSDFGNGPVQLAVLADAVGAQCLLKLVDVGGLALG
jgi:hypothetical protein